MSRRSALHQLGATRQKLLRALRATPQGLAVSELCATLGISHNAVRQHLTALLSQGLIGRGEARPSGGRPQMRYVLLEAARELFPRNYAFIASGLLQQIRSRWGDAVTESLLVDLGRALGVSARQRVAASDDDAELGAALAEQLDVLGYEARLDTQSGAAEVLVWNCVFHEVAEQHPEVCRFDLEFMRAASGRPVEHLECMLRGTPACRFRIGPK